MGERGMAHGSVMALMGRPFVDIQVPSRRFETVSLCAFPRRSPTLPPAPPTMPLIGFLPRRGKVCFRGSNVFVGYYKEDEKTRDAFDEEGWLASGDIGMWTTDGALRIIGGCMLYVLLGQGWWFWFGRGDCGAIIVVARVTFLIAIVAVGGCPLFFPDYVIEIVRLFSHSLLKYAAQVLISCAPHAVSRYHHHFASRQTSSPTCPRFRMP